MPHISPNFAVPFIKKHGHIFQEKLCQKPASLHGAIMHLSVNAGAQHNTDAGSDSTEQDEQLSHCNDGPGDARPAVPPAAAHPAAAAAAAWWGRGSADSWYYGAGSTDVNHSAYDNAVRSAATDRAGTTTVASSTARILTAGWPKKLSYRAVSVSSLNIGYL